MPSRRKALDVRREPAAGNTFTGAHMLATDWAALAGVLLFILGVYGRKLRSGK